MKKLPMSLKLLISMLISGILFYIFYSLEKKYDRIWIDYAKDIFLVVFSQLVITHICAPIVFMIFRMKFNYNSFWFRPKRFESNLYKFIVVKKWKNKVSQYDKNQFSFKVHSMEKVICTMCHAEVVHELTAAVSFLPVILFSGYVNTDFLFVTSLIFSVVHLRYSVIQRYNRPRLIKITERRKDS